MSYRTTSFMFHTLTLLDFVIRNCSSSSSLRFIRMVVVLRYLNNSKFSHMTLTILKILRISQFN